MLVIQRPTVNAVADADGNRQQFSIEPLEPGFGHTLGNSLRRTLLSSIPGAAITQVKFDEALHEFGTINGVREDVTDIVLALKDVELRSHSDEPVTLRIDVSGAVEVTAAALETNEQVEVLNPGLHLASLEAKGRLALELTVEVGRGYLGSDRTSGETTIGVILVDALFSPVRRVSIEVEPVSVGQAQDMDRLVLDVTTDGSITPAEAMASAGATLSTLFQLVEDMSSEARGLELGEQEEVGSGSLDIDLPIEDLDLSERPRNCLKRAQVDTLAQLLEKTEDDLLAVTNFGQKSLDEVIEKLDERGLSLRVRG
ncbi:MAG: DNA-directed RNA polymerase subunit alpha [Acidimicrobiaceae bacterium]|nr:DNA-directed RNA polymerase subunit alpha [Acidimicrobiaceae bacterium]|tara:strand:+ start:9965 stop:10903 length:939 start_codon:yes stop_codon:yes gene_type:complete